MFLLIEVHYVQYRSKLFDIQQFNFLRLNLFINF